ncbi:Protein SCO1-like 1, mitochondrial, partial [Mucuna pruriens]
MASIVSAKANQFRYSSRLLFSHLLRHGTPSTPFSPHLQPLHHPRQVGNQSYGNGSLGLCQRFLSSSTVADNVSGEKAASDSDHSGKNGSGQGKESGGGGEEGQKRDAGKSVRGGPVSWLSFLLLVVTGAGLVFYYDREKKRHIEEIRNNTEAVKQGPSAGKAAIGGPFRLINHHGKYVTEKDFLGKWTLLYFGFTHCPDICPDELQKLAAAVDKIKEKAGIETVPVFISVDPERDTVEQVGEYVKEFHPKLIGLTGSSDEIKNVARAYRVYYMKTEEEDSDYLVDHSIVIYLMSPDMEFVKFFGKNNDVDSLADGVIKEIRLLFSACIWKDVHQETNQDLVLILFNTFLSTLRSTNRQQSSFDPNQ